MHACVDRICMISTHNLEKFKLHHHHHHPHHYHHHYYYYYHHHHHIILINITCAHASLISGRKIVHVLTISTIELRKSTPNCNIRIEDCDR